MPTLASRLPTTLPPWLKPLLFALALLPLFSIAYRLALRPPVDPIKFMIHSTGIWTLRFLCITLTVTPLRRFSGWNALIRLRRMLGLFAFFYGCLHFISYAVIDQGLNLFDIGHDIVKHPYVTVGFAAFCLMIPLAITSTNKMMKRLGRRWQQLHRLIYILVPLGVLHFWWLVKKDIREPLMYAVIVAVLLLLRLRPQRK